MHGLSNLPTLPPTPATVYTRRATHADTQISQKHKRRHMREHTHRSKPARRHQRHTSDMVSARLSSYKEDTHDFRSPGAPPLFFVPWCVVVIPHLWPHRLHRLNSTLTPNPYP